MPRPDPQRLLGDLNDAQHEAVLAVDGPVAILAAAGTGKTRVISRRTAYAIATGAIDPDQVLVVTFTDKAANEMVERLRALGLPGVTARTFHAHALSQLRHFWPATHDGAPLPDLLDSKLPLLVPLVRALPGHYRFTPAKDIADEIEWAKSRRLTATTYDRAVAGSPTAASREPPIPVDLFTRLFAGYERAKARAGRIDFDDLLVGTVELLETDAEAAATVRARKRWFSVDEYQDTNPLQQRLLELWLGERRDVCVVGDEDQTIYTFTGATSRFLTGFTDWFADATVVTLAENYRSTPEVLELANRLLASDGRSKRLEATQPSGPVPTIVRHGTEAAELAALTAWVRDRLGEGIVPAEIAVLVRMNAQVAPIEAALTRAGIAYQVRGIRFFDRPDVRGAIDLVRRADIEARGAALAAAVRGLWATRLGYDDDVLAGHAGEEARERTAALDTLLDILGTLTRSDASVDAAGYLAEIDRRRAAERAGSADGVNLLTYHRAKGLEWDAVALPALEDGILPIRQAFDDDELLAEELRLLYVGITRARRHLAISWAAERETRGRTTRRQPSRFLADLRPRPLGGERRVTQLPDRFAADQGARRAAKAAVAASGYGVADDDPLFAALRVWRTARARDDGVPAYVVFHDQTLAAIAEMKPPSAAALRRVKGVGPAKIDAYGDEVLELVSRLR
ncbi:MAG TPA: ATP-dependent DNA helicase UvrD2 [Candidatus Limnocylindrales bacterium]|nr:ATP-dependent DNA helicase UvrD2 [Candidatus Limnocylindrales bacterium]